MYLYANASAPLFWALVLGSSALVCAAAVYLTACVELPRARNAPASMRLQYNDGASARA